MWPISTILLNSKCLSDYFIAGIRKKVDDLCGCNEEMVRPLNELSPLGSRSNRNFTNPDVMENDVNPNNKNPSNSEKSEKRSKNQSNHGPKNSLKQTSSNSIWGKISRPKDKWIITMYTNANLVQFDINPPFIHY